MHYFLTIPHILVHLTLLNYRSDSRQVTFSIFILCTGFDHFTIPQQAPVFLIYVSKILALEQHGIHTGIRASQGSHQVLVEWHVYGFQCLSCAEHVTVQRLG